MWETSKKIQGWETSLIRVQWKYDSIKKENLIISNQVDQAFIEIMSSINTLHLLANLKQKLSLK